MSLPTNVQELQACTAMPDESHMGAGDSSLDPHDFPARAFTTLSSYLYFHLKI